jgi:hypothetical protein
MSALPPDEPDELHAELALLAAEPLRVEAIDPETGERVEGVIYRNHLAQAIVERDAQS